MGAPQAKVKITAKEFMAKYKSKREIYHFLAVDTGIYLPKYGMWLKTHFLTICFQSYRANFDLLFKGRDVREEEE